MIFSAPVPRRRYAYARRAFSALVLCISLLSANSRAGAQTVIGTGDFDIQKWIQIDDARPTVTIYGMIKQTPKVFDESDKYPSGFLDHDWNFYLSPIPAYAWVVRNRSGAVNTNPGPGQIELEVKTTRPEIGGLDLSAMFPAGTYVRAKGWWVEDDAHSNNKTELHPLISLLTVDPQTLQPPRDGFRLLVAQDQSNRFGLATLPLYESETIYPLPFGGGQNVSQPPNTPSSTTALIQEEAYVDQWEEAQSSGEFQTVAQSSVTFRDVTLSFQLPGLPPYPFYYYVPFYFGTFTRSKASLLRPTATVTVERVGERQVVHLALRAELIDPPGEPIAHSTWEYLDQHVVIPFSTSQHGAQFEAEYAPWRGEFQTRWDLRVVASTQFYDWYPGKHVSAVSGVNGPWKRTWLFDSYAWTLPRSRAEVTATQEIFRDVTNSATRGGQVYQETRRCIDGLTVKVSDHVVISGVDARREWVLEQVRDEAGNVLPHSRSNIMGTLQPGQSGQFGDVSVKTESANPNVASAELPNQEWDGPPGLLTWTPRNRSRYRLSLVLSTGVGETVVAGRQFGAEACPSPAMALLDRPGPLPQQHYGIPIWTRVTVERTLAAMVWMHDHGIAQARGWPASPLPAARIRSALPRGFPPLGEPEGFLRHLPPEGILLFRAYWNAMEGGPITPAEERLLNATGQAARALPQMRDRSTLLVPGHRPH